MSAPSTGPIFIVGANRSGTTLLRLMLNAHSRIAVPEELLYLRSLYAGVPVTEWRMPDLTEANYAELVEGFVHNAALLHPELDAGTLIDEILSVPNRSLRHPYATVLAHWTALQGKARWGEKTPGNLFYVDVLSEMFPDASFIYVVRDPRAGVASMQKTTFFPDDIVFNAMTRRKHAVVGPSLLRQHVAPERWMTVRYEDLVTAPESTLRSVCRVIGEAYEPAMLTYHRDARQFMKEDAAASFNASATRPVTASRIKAWQDALTPEQVAQIEGICVAEMLENGYEFMRPSLSVSRRIRQALEYAIKAVYWQIQTWRHRDIRHYTVRHALFARSKNRLQSLISRLRNPIPATQREIVGD
jgi:hypothetical protein